MLLSCTGDPGTTYGSTKYNPTESFSSYEIDTVLFLPCHRIVYTFNAWSECRQRSSRVRFREYVLLWCCWAAFSNCLVGIDVIGAENRFFEFDDKAYAQNLFQYNSTSRMYRCTKASMLQKLPQCLLHSRNLGPFLRIFPCAVAIHEKQPQPSQR